MSGRALRLGVAGLGRAFALMLPTFVADRRVRLVAAADPRAEARDRFSREFGANAHATVEELCRDPAVEAVYVATPHELHMRHAVLAARHGRHVLVEKPMALTLAECRTMIAAAARAGVALVVGHSHGFDTPIRRAREIVEGGRVGRVRMITALDFTDFLFRPRRPEELATARGGGVAFSQAAHQIDVIRLLGGGLVTSVRARVGAWDRARPTEGAYAALLDFADGAFASAVYSGYAHFDSDEFMGWIGELGRRKDPAAYGAARAALRRAASPRAEAALKRARAYGAAGATGATAPSPRFHEHFGAVLVSCERADLRPLPTGVTIYGDRTVRHEAVPPRAAPRAEVIDELHGAVIHGRAPVHGGAWALATLEVCLALLRSARDGREIRLRHQVATPPLRGRARP